MEHENLPIQCILAATINYSCQSGQSVFIVLGIYNFDKNIPSHSRRHVLITNVLLLQDIFREKELEHSAVLYAIQLSCYCNLIEYNCHHKRYTLNHLRGKIRNAQAYKTQIQKKPSSSQQERKTFQSFVFPESDRSGRQFSSKQMQFKNELVLTK